MSKYEYGVHRGIDLADGSPFGGLTERFKTIDGSLCSLLCVRMPLCSLF